MLENPRFNENGEKILCEMNGKNSEMLMNIKIIRLRAGEEFLLTDNENESAVLLLGGEITFFWDGREQRACRADPFEKKPYCLHVCRETTFRLRAEKDSEIVLQQTDNPRSFPAVFYTPENCLYQEFGKQQWEGTGDRIVSTMFDYENAPYSNMVMGEVFNRAGRWSSYPPHHHPQPEVYYYRFDRPQGFGACFTGDEVNKSTDGSYCTITGGKSHQQAAAPGYEMYYVWMIRHLDGDPWEKTRIYIPEHEWLADAK